MKNHYAIPISVSLILIGAALLLPLLVNSKTARTASAASGQNVTIIESQVVCAAGTHGSCLPGPYEENFVIQSDGWLIIDVYLIHTGHYEPNEQSSFFSPLGDILDCGPIPPDTDEVYCGTVTGWVAETLPLVIEQSGSGPSTGSHRQRYEIKVCEDEIYFPIIIRSEQG